MEERNLSCSLISPLFGHGAYNSEAEFRASELKGVMRYVFRVASPLPDKKLFLVEQELFGGAAGETEIDTSAGNKSSGMNENGHASPVRLLIRGKGDKERTPLLLHEKKNGNNPSLGCYTAGTFQISVRMIPQRIKENEDASIPQADINWYTDLAALSLILCGLGRRCRKGRGSVKLEGVRFTDVDEALIWICGVLNRIARISVKEKNRDFYKICRGEIWPCCKTNQFFRPMIQKISIGRALRENQITLFLRAIDELCHEKSKDKQNCDRTMSTGSGKPRLASPLWMKLVETEKGIYPLYLFVNAVEYKKNGNHRSKAFIDSECIYREQFISLLEEKLTGGRVVKR